MSRPLSPCPATRTSDPRSIPVFQAAIATPGSTSSRQPSARAIRSSKIRALCGLVTTYSASAPQPSIQVAWSPIRTPVTPSPTWSTTPDTSWPRTGCPYRDFGGRRPVNTSTSEPQIPTHATRSRTSPGPAAGSGTVTGLRTPGAGMVSSFTAGPRRVASGAGPTGSSNRPAPRAPGPPNRCRMPR
jgi:hypothetical protein